MKSQVKIGPEFFAKAKNDYSNWKWALIREFFQNSIDCGSRNIQIAVEYRETGHTILTVSNDGDSMTEQILTEKLLSLGSSGKGFCGTVGGFGKAKELLYFCHESYEIKTGDFFVIGSGAEYEIKKSRQKHDGTTSTVTLSGNSADELTRYARQFATLCNVRCRIFINDEQCTSRLPSGRFRRSLSFGRVYTNKSLENLLVVRIGGTPMFTQYCKYAGCVVLELDGQSSEVLTSNRDGLRYEQRAQLESFVQDLCTNKRKALVEKTTEYIRFGGDRVKCQGFAKHQKHVTSTDISGKTTKIVLVNGVEIAVEDVQIDPKLHVEATPSETYNTFELTTEHKIEAKANRIASSFVIKNETGNQVQVWYRPDSDKFGKYAFRLIMTWTKLLVKMHEILGVTDEFSVGFIFTSNDVIAEYEQDGTNGKIYYINPVVLDKGGRQSTRYTLSDREQFNQLIATALHELVHGMGFGDHDENYASKLTDCFGKLLAHGKDLTKCRNLV